MFSKVFHTSSYAYGKKVPEIPENYKISDQPPQKGERLKLVWGYATPFLRLTLTVGRSTCSCWT